MIAAVRWHRVRPPRTDLPADRPAGELVLVGRQSLDLRQSLAFAVDNPTFGQIVGREFDSDPVTGHDSDKVLPHPASDVGHDEMPAFNFHAKTRIRKSLNDHALHFECFFFLFCHTRIVCETGTRKWTVST